MQDKTKIIIDEFLQESLYKDEEDPFIDHAKFDKDIEKFNLIYKNFEEKLSHFFAYFHYKINSLFEFWNDKYRPNGEGHFNADQSRKLIFLIDHYRDIYSNLKNSMDAICILENYQNVIDNIYPLLSNSGGSIIPINFGKIKIIKYDPIFSLKKENTVSINQISEDSRRKIFDYFLINKITWNGSVDHFKFLQRIYNLEQMESTDFRYKNASEDIVQHTINNDDWENDWIFTDKRFDLLNCPDGIFIKFIENTIHPVVRESNDIEKLVSFYNSVLIADGFILKKKDKIGDRDVYFVEKKISVLDKPIAVYKTGHPHYAESFLSKAPCIVLVEDSWNDFGFKTTFRLFFINQSREKIDIGAVKITDGKEESIHERINDSFTQLNSEFISLGDNIEYYEKLYKLGCPIYSSILTILNDIVFQPKLLTPSLKETPVFNKSLLRSSDAEKSFNEAGKLFNTDYIEFEENLKFSFITKLDGAESEHIIDFDFKKSEIPQRINILIGKNGTGKTRILSNIANSLSGSVDDVDKNLFGNFLPRPNFSKIISFSYSAFDYFHIPTSDKYLSYKYCGIRKNDKVLFTSVELKEKFLLTFKIVIDKNRRLDWKNIINQIIDFNIVFQEQEDGTLLDVETKYNNLSSGQKIVITLITEVVAFIENESLLLFDEPELHLHPNGIVNFMSMIYSLLERFNSYAIIATHSPFILQQTPSKYITVLKREGNQPYQDKLSIETFGENFSTISEEIFNTLETESNYKEVLENLLKEHSYDEIISLFDGKLSLNAKIYLNVIMKKNEKSNSASM